MLRATAAFRPRPGALVRMHFPFANTSIHRRPVVGVLIALVVGAPATRACSECGCTLSSDWPAQGYPALPGVTASARFEYYDSNELRTGSHSAAREAAEFPADQELQQETLNRNTWLGLDYVGQRSWAVGAQVPYFTRYHSTVAEGDTTMSESRASGLGDVRVMARYQKSSLYRSYGFQFGLKLPTGRFDQNFATGPQAGAPLDRGLQLGTGTTNLLLGASYFRRASVHVGWFGQATLDQPLHERAGFTPAANVALNLGVRYLNTTDFVPQLQLNTRWDARERGASADGPNSGGVLVHISPGVTYTLASQSSAFVFLQLPLYRRVNGLQLEPHSLLSFGVTWKL